MGKLLQKNFSERFCTELFNYFPQTLQCPDCPLKFPMKAVLKFHQDSAHQVCITKYLLKRNTYIVFVLLFFRPML